MKGRIGAKAQPYQISDLAFALHAKRIGKHLQNIALLVAVLALFLLLGPELFRMADYLANALLFGLLLGRGQSATINSDQALQVAVFRRSEEHTSELQSQSNLVCR